MGTTIREVNDAKAAIITLLTIVEGYGTLREANGHLLDDRDRLLAEVAKLLEQKAQPDPAAVATERLHSSAVRA